MMLRVPHASVLRVGIVVLFYAEGLEALLRARGFAYSDAYLLPAVPVAEVCAGTKWQLFFLRKWRVGIAADRSAGL
jgi:hypothetical protein